MASEEGESLIKKKKVVGDADIFEEIITGKTHDEEDIYEEDKKDERIYEETEDTAEESKEGKDADVSKEEGEKEGFEKERVEETAKAESKEAAKEDNQEVEGEKEDKGKVDAKKKPKKKENAETAEVNVNVHKELQQVRDKIENFIKKKKAEKTKEVKSDEPEEKGKEEEVHDEKEKKPKKEDIKKVLLEKAQQAGSLDDTPHTTMKLKFLEDGDNVFIGTKKSIFSKYKYQGSLFIGKVNEDEMRGKNVYLDSMNPHVVFICGARGSGKSYVLGVIAEELAMKNPNVGIIVIDPIGVFWSMRFPNKEEKELKRLEEFGLKPKGLKNLKVFVPEGIMKDIPKSTYDAGFAMQPSLLTTDDWCLTFGIERFSPTGLLLDKVLKKVENGYKQIDLEEEPQEGKEEEKGKKIRKPGKEIKGKGKNYSLDDLIECLETDDELNSRDRGYKQDSIRAVVSRFEAAKYWGIFSEKGTPLGELSREGQLTILDTSFLEDNVTALVIGILARRVLAARKISTRKEAATQFKTMDVEQLLELEIPPTWMVIDEAHTLVPSGNEMTPASNSIIEYVKQGRRPGCSLVLATQQPSAINTKVLSQLDIMISHKLVFDDDIKAIYKRMPTIVPMAYKKSNFIKTLPVGVALVGDRQEETSRAFVMSIRPRMSQHEGRDTETAGLSKKLSAEEIEELCYESALKDLKKDGKVDKKKIEMLVNSLNEKYKSDADLGKILMRLEKEGIEVEEVNEENGEDEEKEAEDAEKESAAKEEMPEETEEKNEPEPKGKEEAVGESTELLALPKRIDEGKAREIANRIRKKKLLGIIGDEERISSIMLKYFTIWKISYDAFETKSEFVHKSCFIDSITGEFIHFRNGHFVESKGFREIYEISEEEVAIIKELMKKESTTAELMEKGFPEAKVLRTINKLSEKGMINIAVDKNSGKKAYWLKEWIQLPPSEKTKLLSSINELPRERLEALPKEKENYDKDACIVAIKKFWPNIVIRKVEEVYRPVWEIVLEQNAKKKRLFVDAINGELI